MPLPSPPCPPLPHYHPQSPRSLGCSILGPQSRKGPTDSLVLLPALNPDTSYVAGGEGTHRTKNHFFQSLCHWHEANSCFVYGTFDPQAQLTQFPICGLNSWA